MLYTEQHVPLSPEGMPTSPSPLLQGVGASLLIFLSGCEGFITKDYDHRGFHVQVQADGEGGCYVDIIKDTTAGGPGASATQPNNDGLYD